MRPSDEARILRHRYQQLDDAVRTLEVEPADGPHYHLAQTVTVGTYPTSAIAYYAVRSLQLGGIESEGTAPSMVEKQGTFYAANVGTAIPPPGTYVVASLLEGRWVFSYNG